MKKMILFIAVTATLTIVPVDQEEATPSKDLLQQILSTKTGIAAALSAAYPTAKTAYDLVQKKRKQRALTQNLMQQIQYFDSQQVMHDRNFERIELLKADQLSAPCRGVVLYYQQRFIEDYRLYTTERDLLKQALQDGDMPEAKRLYNTLLIRFALLISVSSDMDFNFKQALEKI